MKQYTTIYEQGDHKWTALHGQVEGSRKIITTNEYLVQYGSSHIVTDPGGTEHFSDIIATLSELTDTDNINQVFCSHQDPDVFSSIALWTKIKPDLQIYISKIWISFMLHYAGKRENFIAIDDEGTTIDLGGNNLQAISAHYCHSAGNFNLYDPKANILFSGDIGTALLPEDSTSLFVEDFDQHIQHSEAFHRRWMGSNEHKNQWCERIYKLKPDMLCPQHGSIYKGEMINRFLDWFYELKVGDIEYLSS